jgi:hypothetical protein
MGNNEFEWLQLGSRVFIPACSIFDDDGDAMPNNCLQTLAQQEIAHIR